MTSEELDRVREEVARLNGELNGVHEEWKRNFGNTMSDGRNMMMVAGPMSAGPVLSQTAMFDTRSPPKGGGARGGAPSAERHPRSGGPSSSRSDRPYYKMNLSL